MKTKRNILYMEEEEFSFLHFPKVSAQKRDGNILEARLVSPPREVSRKS